MQESKRQERVDQKPKSQKAKPESRIQKRSEKREYDDGFDEEYEKFSPSQDTLEDSSFKRIFACEV